MSNKSSDEARLLSGSRLEKTLREGHFAVTAEIGPPIGCDANVVIEKGDLLRDCADAFNITDNQTAVVRLSSIAAAILLIQRDIEPVMQMTCRDRNRIAIQSDVLGAAGFGIRNCLCIAGDHQSFGAAGRLKGHPGSMNVYDVDSIQLIAILKKMRDEATLEGGDELKDGAPKLFIGAAWTPVEEAGDVRVLRLNKKVDAGADFIQTQGIYDIEGFKSIMSRVRDLGLHTRTAILGGVIVPKSAGMLRYMQSSVAGVTVPDALIRRMSQAKKGKARAEGKKIAVELIQQLGEIEGVSGVHVQAIEWEEAVPEIVKEAGMLPRPNVRPTPLGEA
ncbi:MAG: methylenetetrahydrofolate reductase [Planctomycetota bacterium]